MPIRILVGDDHDEFRAGIRRLLESERDFVVIGEVRSGAEAVQRAAEEQPDIVLLDVRMAPVSGIEAIPRILQESPGTAVLMLSMHADRRYVARSLAAGAKGYVTKDSVDVLIDAIRRVCAGERFFSPRANLSAGAD